MKDYILNATIEEGLDATRLPEFTAEEKLEIMGSSDFLGLNHYTTNLAEPNVNQTPGWGGDQDIKTTMDDSWPYSSALWLRVVPWGFRKILKWLKDTYDNPTIYVTENGFADYAGSDASDVQRVRYYESYINEMLKAIVIDQVNVTSYTAWSLMDVRNYKFYLIVTLNNFFFLEL
jgi:beta-glucosidase/6-phospho-beta-glucosidase/beta-galactosidase